ncbi:MAG: methylmalonyl Co-A mutase-associated GTPase MeaB [Acidimicrobiia bacterium]|nr:methylmalonyl Co-A mutase-associated GTPase MeaB [Acidimicrobiia bacterium]
MPLTGDVDDLAAAAFDGDRRALARLITIVEEGRPGASRALGLAYPRSGRSYRIGITGAPGAGKSTLTDGLITALRRSDGPVAVLAVDPTSPFSGGAVLGDRVRMQDHASDPGVYIRSMASRGHLGGLSSAAPKGLTLLDAAGFPYLLIETVGVGQDEVEVADAADTTVVVVTPGWGDGVQAAKAGILEIGDVFVVNKADRPGVDDAVADLRTMLAMGGERPWAPPILTTVASRGAGVTEVLDAVLAHRAHLEAGGLEEGRRQRRRGELRSALAAALARRSAAAADSPEHRRLVALVEAGQLDPWTAAEHLLGAVASG